MKNKVKKILAWVGTALFAIFIFFGGIASLVWLLAALNIIPIEKWQLFKKEKLKMGTMLSVILGIVLFIVGCMMLPNEETDNKPEKTKSKTETSVTTTVSSLKSNETTTKTSATTTPIKSTTKQTVENTTTTTIKQTISETTTIATVTTTKDSTTTTTTTTTKPTQTTTTTTTIKPKQTSTTTSKTEEIFDYVVNTNTCKFHEPGCNSVDTIKENNRMDYRGTKEELIAMGYEGCKRCNP